MTSILAKIGKDRYLLGALLVIFVLLTTAPPSPPSGRMNVTRWEDYGRLLEPENAPAHSAFLLRLLSIIFLTLLVSGLVLDLQAFARRNWRVFPPEPAASVPWGPAGVVRLTVYFFACFLLLVRGERIFLGLLGFSPPPARSWLLLINAFLQFLLLLGLAELFLRRYRSPGPALLPAGATGFRLPALISNSPGEWGRRLRQALKGYICFFPLLLLLGLLAWAITRTFHLPWQSHPLVEPLLEEGRGVLILPLLIVGIIFAPLAEEVFFRGLLLPALSGRVGKFWSATITAALFATLHFNWFGWLPIFGLGLLLARGFQRTGSLLVPIFIHAFHNALFLTFTVLTYQAT